MAAILERVAVVADQVWYLLEQGGWVMLAIFLLGQIGWFLVMERWWTYRRQTREVLDLLDADQTVGAGPAAQAALEARLLADKRLRGMFAEIVTGLVSVRNEGEEAMVRKAREIIHRGSHRVHRHLGTIAAVASAAPMLGLAGTVGGVMVTFQVITLYGIGNPSMMAGGIAEALMVTEAALVVALPLMILHDRLATRADQIESECVAGATRLIRAFSPSGQGHTGTLPLGVEHDDHMGNHGSAVRI
jgi:biopolymer transport protein ExbB